MPTIIDRIRANGGDVIRTEWRFTLRRGRLDDAALAWVRAHWLQVVLEAWPEADNFLERAAIRQYCGGQARADAEREAYQESTGYDGF